ncbi:CHAT domain-containing protein [Streptomyces sp. 4N509B]|uniref:CHAT domain-containing protein n=1 Tax=Streptomyces sp. 4N509B TaxID=3457413 RepID=UPI003FD1575D
MSEPTEHGEGGVARGTARETRDALVAALVGRVETALSSGNAAGLFSREAEAEAERLLAWLATPDGLGPEVMYAVGVLHWARVVFDGEEHDPGDAERAGTLLVPLYLSAPTSLPEPLRVWFREVVFTEEVWGPEPEGEERTRALVEAQADVAMTLLMDRFLRLGDVAAGDLAVELLREAARALPRERPSRPVLLAYLGQLLFVRDERRASAGAPPSPTAPALGRPPEMPHLAEATAALREAHRATPPDHPNHLHCTSWLAVALRARGVLGGGDAATLREAAELFCEVADAVAEDHEELPEVLHGLGITLLAWLPCAAADGGRAASRLAARRRAVVEVAVDALRRSVELTEDGAPELAFRAETLTGALVTREQLDQGQQSGAERPGDGPDDDLMAVVRRMAAAVPDDQPSLLLDVLAQQLGEHVRLGGGGAGLVESYVEEQARGLAEVRQSMERLRRLAEELPPDAPGREAVEAAVDPSFLERLEEAQGLVRRAYLERGRGPSPPGADASPTEAEPGPERPPSPGVAEAAGALSALLGPVLEDAGLAEGGLLHTLLQGGSIAELADRWWQETEQRYAHLPERERARALLRTMLAEPEQSDEPGSMPSILPTPEPAGVAMAEEVIAVAERMMRELPSGHRDHVLLRSSRTLLRLYVQGPLPWTPPRAGSAAGGPGEPVAERYRERMGELVALMSDLPAAMAAMGMSAELVGPMNSLTASVASPFEAMATADAMVRELRERLAALPARTPEHAPERVEALRSLAFWHFNRAMMLEDPGDYGEGAAVARRLAAGSSLTAIDVMAWAQATLSVLQSGRLDARRDAEELPTHSVARQAAAMAADAVAVNDAPGALETLEDGRSFMLSRAMSARRELDALRRADPALAARFEDVRDRLTALHRRWVPDVGMVAEQRALAEEWAALSADLDGLGGFDRRRFMLPRRLGWRDLLPAAAEGPVVMVNVTPTRCHALLVREDGVRNVPLPELRAADVLARAAAFHEAIAALTGGGGRGRVEAAAAAEVVTETLGWLWDVVAKPVLDALGFTDTPSAGEAAWPRVWWSPGGPLASLPLHAAGHHEVPGEAVLDRVVSSYTPTLRALLFSRSHDPERAASSRTALVTALPETPGHAPLPHTVAEAEGLSGRLPGAVALTGPRATRAAVLEALNGASVAHFACHAASDPASPEKSRLLLHDGPLGLVDVGQLRLGRAELAYLSACGTARGSTRLADEAIHVASAFQLAGYGQVVATLWEIGDAFAASVGSDFYGRLGAALAAPGRLPAAHALHAVIREVRAGLPHLPWTWSSLVHAGA